MSALDSMNALKESLSLDVGDMDQLARLLTECHLEEDLRVAAAALPPMLAQPQEGPPAEELQTAQPWAEELTRRLQGCASPAEAPALCAEFLVGFRQQAAQQQQQLQQQACHGAAGCEHARRLESVRGANRVIVRALRALSEKQREASERARQAECAAMGLAEELRRCQEQLQASERSKAMLQAHLQVMSSSNGGVESNGFVARSTY